MKASRVAWALVLSACVSIPAFAQTAKLEGLGHLNTTNPYTFALGMSGKGDVVVGMGASDSFYDYDYFMWTPTLRMVAVENAPTGTPSGCISRDGWSIFATADDGWRQLPIRWSLNGGRVELDDPGDDTRVTCCSANGSIAYGTTSIGARRLVRWTGTTAETFPVASIGEVIACSDDGTIAVGTLRPSTGPGVAFCWTASGGVERLGKFGGYATACSADAKTIVGVASNADGDTGRAFRWTEADGLTYLKTPAFVKGAVRVSAYDCSANGRVVVGSIHPGSSNAYPFDVFGAYVWIDGEPYFLKDILAARGIATNAWRLDDATACSSDGTVLVGSGGKTKAGKLVGAPSFRTDIVNLKRPAPNRRPVANAGKDIVVTTTKKFASVRLSGAASRDPDGHRLTYFWTAKGLLFSDPTSARPESSFPIGTTTVTLTVFDERGAKSSDVVKVIVKRAATADGVGPRTTGDAEGLDYDATIEDELPLSL